MLTVTGAVEPVVAVKLFRHVFAGMVAVLRSMLNWFPPASVSDYGEKTSGVEVYPYALSRKRAPTVPNPFTRELTSVGAGLRFVVFEGASWS